MIEGGCNLLLGLSSRNENDDEVVQHTKDVIESCLLAEQCWGKNFLIEPNPLPYKIHKVSSEISKNWMKY